MPETMMVLLDFHQQCDAHDKAWARQTMNVENGARDRYGAPTDFDTGLKLHTVGCIGEKAVSVGFGIKWDGALGQYDKADVGDLEVRCTDLPRDDTHLLLHPGETGIFVKARWLRPFCDGKVLLEGWQWAHIGMAMVPFSDKKGNSRPAYWLPIPFLNDMPDLGAYLTA